MPVITVGESSSWVQELVDRASKLKVGSGFDPSTDVYVPSCIMTASADALGVPVISPAAKERIEGLIQTAVDEGAEILLDGRNPVVEGFSDGNWVGPTVIRGTPEMTAYTYVKIISYWLS